MGFFNPHPGSWFKLPDYGITELFTKKKSPQGGSDILPNRASASPQVLSSQTSYQSPYQSNPYQSSGGFGALLPASGGQPAGGGGGGAVPTTSDSGGGDSGTSYEDQLRAAYDYARSLYEQQFPGLEADYTRIKGDLEGAVGRAKEAYGEQKQDIAKGYGEGLRNLLQSDRELGQKSRNVYSGLNALDSSSFAESNERARQSLFETQGKLTSERERANREAERQYSAYESQANQALADLGNQYMSGKQALQQAIASNNIEEANAITNYLQNLNNTINTYKLNLASLQAQGTDVVGALQQLNRGGLDQIFGNYLKSTYEPMVGSLNIPSRNLEGVSGYISPRTGKKYGSYDEYLKAEG